ncbi:MAG TPA: chitobiase/beta-hexosaminidase C-terminal domain-containing protein, partial [Candidatus Wallbacteria bacterium]|nr:chitobiase/beta-hexosaminidase C-terminal domain-containing protein [Candidatus Wallbacteria bacterium]
MRKNVAQNSFVLILLFCLFIFAGCDCDENSYNAISPTPLPRADKELIIEGPLPDVAAGGGVSFAPGAPSRAAEFGEHYVIVIIDRDDPAQTRELAPVAIDGNTFKAIIPISDSRMSPLIVIKNKDNNQNLLLAAPGKVPAYQEVPEKVRQILVRGMIIDPQSTARSLLAIAKNVNPDIPMVTIAPEEETLENVIREIISGQPSRFDSIIENNIGGATIVKEFSKAVQTVTVILSSERVAEEVKNGLNQTLGGTPDAVSLLAAYVSVLNSDDTAIINALNTSQLPRSVQLSETVIDARTSGSAIKNVIQNTIDEPADKTTPAIEYASLSPSIVKNGDTISLEFRVSEPLACSPVVRILGRTASVVALNDRSYKAYITIVESDTLSEAGFIITEIYDRYGNKGETASRTTDGSAVKIDRTLAITAPEISIPGGSYDTTISVSLKSAIENATIKYTLDGSLPSANNGFVYNSRIVISQSLTLKAVAMLGVSSSGVSSAAYVIKIPLPKAVAPVFKPVGSTYYSAQTVTLSSATPGATIKYTLDGTKPSESGGITYAGPFEVASSLKALAVACKEGMETSELSVAVYTIEPAQGKVEKPSITPSGGVFTSTISVSLVSPTPGASIIYTLDGAEPSAGKGIIYNGPFELIKSCTLKAAAIKSKMYDSEIASATFEISLPLPRAAKPTLTPPSGTYDATVEVVIKTATSGASIFYTLDGTEPSAIKG